MKSFHRGENILSCKFNKHTKYLTVNLYDHGKRKTVDVHRLVAMAFIENVENKKCVNHIDGNKTNNYVKNLEWCTYSENLIHAYKTGLRQKKSASVV